MESLQMSFLRVKEIPDKPEAYRKEMGPAVWQRDMMCGWLYV
jgi:hypothetical protein